MKKITNDLLKESYYYEKLDNGLRVYLWPKEDFNKTFGIMATRYGSIDRKFVPLDSDDYVEVPDGIAHFLEHKLFDMGDVDANDLFSELGAEANAYTSYDRTAYLFSATTNIDQSLTLLLDFVQQSNFTDEAVEREQGIIEQELLMYLDKPSTAIYTGLLETMFEKNHVRIDIGGTLSSIKKINKDLLDLCYQTFYHPSNMVLVVVGKFDAEHIMTLIKENQAKKTFIPYKKIKREYLCENNVVFKSSAERKMDVIIPKTAVGLKIGYEGLTGHELMKKNFALNILIDMFFDQSSDNYQYLLENEIINNTYGYNVFYEETYAYVDFSTESLKYEEFNDFIKQKLLELKNAKIDPETFEKYKRINIADVIRKFNSPEYIGNLIIDMDFKNLTLFDVLTDLLELTIEDLKEVRSLFIPEALCTFVIKPKKKISSY
jgi:predicted Zn-dependent peptidase